MSGVASELPESTTYTSPTSRKLSRHCGRFRASLRVATITLIGTLAVETIPSAFSISSTFCITGCQTDDWLTNAIRTSARARIETTAGSRKLRLAGNHATPFAPGLGPAPRRVDLR